MARKGKNENLKDRAGERPKQRKKDGHSGGASSGCPHSIGILPYMLETPTGPRYHREMDNSRQAQLRRAFKREYGYKPVGLSVQELERILTDRSIERHGDPNYIFDHME